jgi:hypothetical protein
MMHCYETNAERDVSRPPSFPAPRNRWLSFTKAASLGFLSFCVIYAVDSGRIVYKRFQRTQKLPVSRQRFTNNIAMWDFRFSRQASMKWVFWDVTPSSVIAVDQRFRGAYYLHHQGDVIPPFPPSLLSIGHQRSFSGGKAQSRPEADQSPPSEPRSRISRS